MKKGLTTLMVVVFMMAEYALSKTSWSDHENRTTVSLEWDSPYFDTDFMGPQQKDGCTSRPAGQRARQDKLIKARRKQGG